MKANIERNKQLVELRDKDQKIYSFGKLAEIFRIKTSTAFEIYHREKAKNGKRVKSVPVFVQKKYPALGVSKH